MPAHWRRRPAPESDSLDLTTKVALDASPALWQMLAGTIGGIDGLFEGDTKRQPRPVPMRCRASRQSSSNWAGTIVMAIRTTTKQLRSSLIGSLSSLGDQQVIAEARRRFTAR